MFVEPIDLNAHPFVVTYHVVSGAEIVEYVSEENIPQLIKILSEMYSLSTIEVDHKGIKTIIQTKNVTHVTMEQCKC